MAECLLVGLSICIVYRITDGLVLSAPVQFAVNDLQTQTREWVYSVAW